MLSRNFLSNLKNFNKKISKNSLRYFANNTNSLKSVLKEEINSEEKNYSPVDSAELNQFYQSTKFEFVEKNSTLMELKKNNEGTDITIRFYSKPPMPSNDQEENSNQEDAGNLYF
jgi:hypothetical protein